MFYVTRYIKGTRYDIKLNYQAKDAGRILWKRLLQKHGICPPNDDILASQEVMCFTVLIIVCDL